MLVRGFTFAIIEKGLIVAAQHQHHVLQNERGSECDGRESLTESVVTRL